jgi:hypothetical protein
MPGKAARIKQGSQPRFLTPRLGPFEEILHFSRDTLSYNGPRGSVQEAYNGLPFHNVKPTTANDRPIITTTVE